MPQAGEWRTAWRLLEDAIMNTLSIGRLGALAVFVCNAILEVVLAGSLIIHFGRA